MHLQTHTEVQSLCANVSSIQLAGDGALMQLRVQNNAATAIINLQGAQLVQWQPGNHAEVIWISGDSPLRAGKAQRGGIPVCWPWFGAHKTYPDYPAHGFARTVMWHLGDVSCDGDTTELLLHLPEENMPPVYAFSGCKLHLRIRVGNTLQLSLSTLNESSSDITITQALHTYFRVGDINATRLSGLEGQRYLDKVLNFAPGQQNGALNFASETDRIYLPSETNCTIHDPVLNRKIVIEKSGSNSTVVWNPWQEAGKKMGDLGHNGYLHMLCVESANAADDFVTLAPGQSHSLNACYKVC